MSKYLPVGGTKYLLVSTQPSHPSLKCYEHSTGRTYYANLLTSKPTTPTWRVSKNGVNYYVNHPRLKFTITLPINMGVSCNDTRNGPTLKQLKAYSATWSFRGSVRQNQGGWVEHSRNHGDVYMGGHRIYNIGHPHEHDTGWKSVHGSGTLKNDSLTTATVSAYMRLHGVGSHSYSYGGGGRHDREPTHVSITPTTYLSGTLTITGYKLPG